MFKSITETSYNHKARGSTWHLVDSEFECDILYKWDNSDVMVIAPIIMEYKNRNKDIISNIYLYNMFIAKEYGYSFDSILEYQNKWVDKEYPEYNLNFTKEIYPKLLKIHKKYQMYT